MSGRIKSILPKEKGVSKAGKDWSKQVFVLETEDKYNNEIPFSIFNDSFVIEDWMKGAKAKVTFSIGGRSYVDKAGNTRHNTELSVWKMEVDERRKPKPVEPEPVEETDDDPDLPF